MTKLREVPASFSDKWIGQLDGRTQIAQVMRERFSLFTDDLGGAGQLSYAQRSLVSRALWLEHWLIMQEQELAQGGDFDVGKWVQACNSLQGILSKLGLHRHSKDIPDLSTYLKQGSA